LGKKLRNWNPVRGGEGKWTEEQHVVGKKKVWKRRGKRTRDKSDVSEGRFKKGVPESIEKT